MSISKILPTAALALFAFAAPPCVLSAHAQDASQTQSGSNAKDQRDQLKKHEDASKAAAKSDSEQRKALKQKEKAQKAQDKATEKAAKVKP
jgi:hypothetical protein